VKIHVHTVYFYITPKQNIDLMDLKQTGCEDCTAFVSLKASGGSCEQGNETFGSIKGEAYFSPSDGMPTPEEKLYRVRIHRGSVTALVFQQKHSGSTLDFVS
jgi:hypothetical protein